MKLKYAHPYVLYQYRNVLMNLNVERHWRSEGNEAAEQVYANNFSCRFSEGVDSSRAKSVRVATKYVDTG